jgi:hypothetical protein
MRLMRRLTVFGAAATVFALTAPSAHASSNVTNEKFQTVDFRVNTCTDEAVTLVGTVHELVSETGRGGVDYDLALHFTGVGYAGDDYMLNSHERIHESSSSLTVALRELLVSKGPGANQMLVVKIAPNTVAVTVDCTA